MDNHTNSKTAGRKQGKAAKCALLASALLFAPEVAAQDADVAGPLDLFNGGRATGVRIAPGLVLSPSIEATVEHDSNIYNDEFGKLDDVVGELRPELLFRTELSRHYSELRLNSVITRHADITAEDSEQFGVSGLTRLDLGSRVGLSTQGGVARSVQQRGTAGDQFATDEPIEFTRAWAGAELSRTGGLLELFAGGQIDDFDYSNTVSGGLPVDLTVRDVQILRGHLRGQYALGPATRLFVLGEVNSVEYDLPTLPSRDSDGYSVLAGIAYEVTALVEAEVAVGYEHQSFDDPTVNSVDGLDFSVQLTWTPTPRWEVTASGLRAVDASPLNDAPAILRTQFDLGALTVVSDRVLLQARLGYMQEDYRGTGRTDDRYMGQVGMQYRINDNFGATVHLGYRKQDSNFFAESYNGFSAGVGLVAQF